MIWTTTEHQPLRWDLEDNINMRVKYPHTMHFPWSPGLQNDDRVIQDNKLVMSNTIIMTEKLDGENTTMYREGIHARSLSDMARHPSRTLVQALHGKIKHDIPSTWRICGENCYAKHSIHYCEANQNVLDSCFQVFGIWNENYCLSWKDTEKYCRMLGLHTVPVLYIGIYDEEFLKSWYKPCMTDKIEGYVVRIAESFTMDRYENVVAKYVRKGHVQTSEHWLNEPLVKNEFKYD
jgi:hypothetical protein